MRSPTIGWFSVVLDPHTRTEPAASMSSKEFVAAPVPSIDASPTALGA